jgi:hypothetical protein
MWDGRRAAKLETGTFSPPPHQAESMTVAIRRSALATLSLTLGNPGIDPAENETFGDALLAVAVRRIRDLTDALAVSETRARQAEQDALRPAPDRAEAIAVVRQAIRDQAGTHRHANPSSFYADCWACVSTIMADRLGVLGDGEGTERRIAARVSEMLSDEQCDAFRLVVHDERLGTRALRPDEVRAALAAAFTEGQT